MCISVRCSNPTDGAAPSTLSHRSHALAVPGHIARWAFCGKRTIALDGQQFIGRLLQQVLPSGFKHVRHYGLLAPATKTARLARARQLLRFWCKFSWRQRRSSTLLDLPSTARCEAA